MSAEYNLKKLLHEVRHLKHIRTKMNKRYCEDEANYFENYLVDYAQLVNFID